MATRGDDDNGDKVVPLPKRSTLLPPAKGKPGGKAEEPAAVPPIDDLDLLPEPGDPYKAYGRPGNSAEGTLHVLFKDGSSRGFCWGNFDSVDMVLVPGGTMLLVRFNGLEPTELRICGSNLERLRVLIGRLRIVWIREHPSLRGFEGAAAVDDRAEVITGIIPMAWEPARKAGQAGGK
jgi:hypothetical protein